MQKNMSFHEHLHLPAQRQQLAKIRRFVELQARKTSASEDEVNDLVQAVDEAATNVIVHGYQDSPGEIDLDLERQPGRIIIILRDQAPPFDPTTVPEPDLSLPLDQRPVGGLGVFLIRRCVDEFSHQACSHGGNELRMVKYLKDNGGLE